MRYNANILKNLLQKEHIVQILENLGVSGINERDPNGIRCSCPIHGSSNTTLFVYNPDKHLYTCYGECEIEKKDGDIIRLVEICENLSYNKSIEYICKISSIDINLIKETEEHFVEEVRNTINLLLNKIDKDNEEIDFNDYGVKPLDENIYSKFKGLKDDQGYIDSLGFSESILTLFESGYDSKDKRWLLPIKSPDGILLGLDGRDITNTSKSKWKKTRGLLSNKLLGRLDLSKQYIYEEDAIVLCEGKKDQMSFFDADIKNCSCLYGSTLSDGQYILLQELCSKIYIAPDGDTAGYKMVQTIVKKCYPEFEIVCLEIEDGDDPATISKKCLKELYDNAINVEEWLKKYKYREKKSKK